ncbi:MAG: hypothetical protein FWE08_00800 [Oscillospiraceae bacterium]|nr:hypothetical protein [Oscillospiraceae bacterium]
MTREEMLQLTGFKPVGEGKDETVRGLLFGFPAEAALQEKVLLKTLNIVCAVDAPPDSKQLKAVKKRLKEDARTKDKVTIANAVPGSEVTGKFFVVTLTFVKDDAGTWYEQAMDALETALREEGITAPTGCAICGQSGSDALAHYDGRLALVHMSCLRTWKDSQQEALELKKQNSGHLRGVIGGLIGGIVGALPALLALNFMDYFVGVLFAIIPMGIYFGWKVLGGKLSKITTVFTIIYTLLVALTVEIIDTWLRLREIIPTFTLMQTIESYLDIEFFTEYLMRYTLIALGASIFGIFCAWKMITRTDKHEHAEVQAAFDDATPLNELTKSR